VLVAVSPYFDPTDFSALHRVPTRGTFDPVSIADLLRNAFVCPPHSIYAGLGVASFGFGIGDDGTVEPASRFRFPIAYQDARHDATDDGALVRRYHELLCESVSSATRGMQSPWMLQSGGKDSTSLAIAMAEARPDAVCFTYLGGSEEDEVASASLVSDRLGLAHETLVCDPGRAYDRYLAMLPRMPLLTADFALLSYVDIAVEAANRSADGLVDGLGSDCYFGMPTPAPQRLLLALARCWRWPRALLPVAAANFPLSFLLGSLQMGEERHFPGSRFSDAECDALLGHPLAADSRRRFEVFRNALDRANHVNDRRAILTVAAEAAAGFAKGIYTAHATSLQIAFPYCDPALRHWVCNGLPPGKRMSGDRNKVLVREHIATRFKDLPYVAHKGSFRFDLVGLTARFEQVLAFAEDARSPLPGAPTWLKRNRRCLQNKFHASRFYLLAVALPWLLAHSN